ncbi:MAG: Trm112 family protein [Planctomycetes bacterium]|nr:Trm112 family protein [Planctomycetota bacterium]
MGEPNEGESSSKVSKELLEILACPLGHEKLTEEGGFLVCGRCGVRFRIEEEGIPNMLIEDAVLPEGITDISQLPCQKEKP